MVKELKRANDNTDERSTEMTITCGSDIARVKVIQQAAGAVRVSPQEIHAPAEGGAFDLNVDYNIEYHTIIGANAEGWVSVAPGSKALTSGKIGLVVSANDSGWPRSGSVTVTSDAGDIPITVSQDGADIFSLSGMSRVWEAVSPLPFRARVHTTSVPNPNGLRKRAVRAARTPSRPQPTSVLPTGPII